jgi:asparagine synthase (glutamine-hydrolysing)
MPYETETCCVTADARLDNRDELLSLLREFPDLKPGSPDSVFLARAYEKFGEDCVLHLRGDFAFAAWDKRKRLLFAARDHLGVKPFYYYEAGDLLVFATEKKGLLALDRVDASVNTDYIYALLADRELQPGEGFHRHIKALPGAHRLVAGDGGMRTSLYWTLQPKPLLELPSDEAYAEALRAELSMAVGVRLRSAFPVGCELSGGLDSSGVAGLSARLMDDPSRLLTFSNVLAPDATGRKPYPDEESYIDEFIQFAGIRQAIKVTGSHWKYLQEPHDMDIRVHDGIEPYSACWQEPIRLAMEAKGCRVCLSGFGGDEVVTNRGTYYYFEFLEEGDFGAFSRAARAAGNYTLPLTTFLRQVLPAPLRILLNRDTRKRPRRNSYLLDPGWEARRDRMYPENLRITNRSHKQLLLKNVDMLVGSGRLLTESLYGIQHRIEPRYPFADIRLLEFFLSLPARVLGHPGINRYLYREAMKGILPETTRLRNEKNRAAGIFALQEDREQASELSAWLLSVEKQHGPGLLDKVDFQKLITGLDPSLPVNQGKLGFEPARSFRAELIIRYVEKAAPGLP